MESETKSSRSNWQFLELIVVLGIVVVIATGFSPVWNPSGSPGHTGQAIFISADGRKVISVSSEAHPVLSYDSGNSWATNATMTYYMFNEIAGSADGTKLVGAFFSNPGYIYTSTDSGFTWTQTASVQANWRAVASSADGVKLAAVVANGSVYTSTDSGLTWQPRSLAAKNWATMASSADGNRLWLLVTDGEIFTSTNSGTNWAGITSPVAGGSSIACSADGNKLVVVGKNVFVSTNAGGNWSSTGITGNLAASSADGTRLVVAGGPVYTSADSGTTWQSNSAPTAWSALASSADGCTLAGTSGQFPNSSGTNWLGRLVPSPRLNLAVANGAVACSWILPSTNFVLQQNLNLGAPNWVAVTNVPVLNLTNLQQQLTLTASNNAGFYRLSTPQ